jgi:hypothetical protein
MDWNNYRMLMKGEISPYAAVARAQPQPAARGARGKPGWGGAAYDAALPRRSRDQSTAPAAKFDDQVGSGQLGRSYVDATNSYLRNAGLSDEDCEVVAAVLQKYVDPGASDAENLNMPEQQQIRVGGPRGPVGAGDRRLALDELDMFGRPRRELVTAMLPGSESSGFSRRFPSATKIRVL